MGGSSWSDDFYNDRQAHRAATGTPVFQHDADIKQGRARAGVHDKLNPKGVKVRESRDSAAHPESLAIAVIFDETGSMGTVPIRLQTKLTQLMGLLLRKGYVAHPQILFGAVGDATHGEAAPLQIGQFESGVEMDDDLSKIFLEGNGGGQGKESYQNVFYFFARHTSIDCFEKRGQKGYLFVIGDEMSWPMVTPGEVSTLIGDALEKPIAVEDIIREAQEKYHVFFVIPEGHGGDHLLRYWQKLVGAENVIQLDNAENVCEAIGLAIGYQQGTADPTTAADDLKSVGVDAVVADRVTKALAPLAHAARGVANVVKVNLPAASAPSSAVERL